MEQLFMQKKLTNEILSIPKYSDRYLIYTRRSTDDPDNQKNSIEYQIATALKFAEQQHLKIASTDIKLFCKQGIISEHHSGYKSSQQFEILSDGSINQKVQRPKFLMMAELLQKKHFKGVICLCWDRISRNEADDVIIKKLMYMGIDILFVQASYENTSAGWLHMDVDGVFSRHYSRAISEKVKNTAMKLRAEGKCIYTSPLGYLDKGSQSKPFDQKRAPIVKRLFQLYATGEWSYNTLAQWANQQGLTTKPVRRKRTREERLSGVSLDSIPKQSRRVTPKSIENMLSNPFYIGKNVHNKEWIDSTAHQPLIDSTLFMKVSRMRKDRTISAHYPEKSFAVYRGLVSCGECGRTYSPYIQKGIMYYRLKCKANCKNKTRNLNEKTISELVFEILNKIYLSEEERIRISEVANLEIDKITDRRSLELESLQGRYRKALEDYDYLIKERLYLLRTKTFSTEELHREDVRLSDIVEALKIRIGAYGESVKAMFDYVMTFSALIQNKALYFETGLDSEQNHIVCEVFSKLSISDGKLKYEAKEGYKELLKRFECSNTQSGSADYLFSKLIEIYIAVKNAKSQLDKQHNISKRR